VNFTALELKQNLNVPLSTENTWFEILSSHRHSILQCAPVILSDLVYVVIDVVIAVRQDAAELPDGGRDEGSVTVGPASVAGRSRQP